MNNEEKIINSDFDKNVNVKIIKDKCNFLYKIKKPFTLVKTGSTWELHSSIWKARACKGGFSVDDLQFINSVKQYVLKNEVIGKFIKEDYQNTKIKYIDVKKYEEGEYIENLLCVDMDGAYWRTAYLLGIISKGIYNKGLNDVNKVVRLAALGSLAKQKDIWDFDGVKIKKNKPIKSYTTENLWFAICKRVSDVMQEIKKEIGDDFIFYWVDGVYIKNKADVFKKVTDVLLKNGYTSHSELISHVVFTNSGFEVQGATIDEVKRFSWHNGKENKPVSEYIENKRLLKIANEIIYERKKPK